MHFFLSLIIGLYTFSPAGPEYIISVPLFDKVEFKPGDSVFTIIKARPQIYLLLQKPSSEMKKLLLFY